jgi:hypothetical protein
MFIGLLFALTAGGKILNINVKSDEPLKMYKPSAVLLPV